MSRVCLFLAALVLVLPGAVSAQGISGAADWTYGRSTTSGGGSTTTNSTLTQTYTAGYRSILWDPRFLQYEGELTLRRLSMGLNDQNGRLSDTAYRFGATLFNSGPFPLSVSALRSFGLESGNLPSGNALRGGLLLPTTGEAPELNTRTSSSSVLWHLDTPRLPRVELAYRRARSEVSASTQTVSQRDRLLSLLASRKTGPLSNELRFQRTSFENEFSADFTQRLTELAYDGNATLRRNVRTTSRLGYRNTFSLFDAPVRMTDFGQESFGAPSRGESSLRYAIQSVSWEVSERLGTDLTVGYDTSSGQDVSTRSLLTSATARYRFAQGLMADVTGMNAARTQVVRGTSIDTLTRSATTGVSYAFGVRHLQVSNSVRGGRGRATTPDGLVGRTTLWNGQSSVSSDVLRWIDLGALYEKGRTTDDLLVFGNYAVERKRLTARTRLGTRGSVEAQWERSFQERGRDADLHSTDFLTQSIGGSYALARAHQLTFSVGRFRTEYRTEVDSTRFAEVNYDGRFTPFLRTAASFRQEVSSRRLLDQTGYVMTGLLEYRVRLFAFGLEQRLTNIDYRTPNRDPFLYHGNSFLIRINRRFGWMF